RVADRLHLEDVVEARIESRRGAGGRVVDRPAIREDSRRIGQVDVVDDRQLVAPGVHHGDRRGGVVAETAVDLRARLPGVPDLEIGVYSPRRLLADRAAGDAARKRRRTRRRASEGVNGGARRAGQLQRLLVAAENRLVVHQAGAGAQYRIFID